MRFGTAIRSSLVFGVAVERRLQQDAGKKPHGNVTLYGHPEAPCLVLAPGRRRLPWLDVDFQPL